MVLVIQGTLVVRGTSTSYYKSCLRREGTVKGSDNLEYEHYAVPS